MFEPFEAKIQLPDFSNQTLGYKWDSMASSQQFKAALNQQEISGHLESMIKNEYSKSVDGNNELNKALTNCLHRAEDSSLKTKKLPKTKAHKKWFNLQCDLSRRNMNRLANRLGNKHSDTVLRREYFKQRNKHSNLVNSKKLLYLKITMKLLRTVVSL
jgi:hypothetical protein